MTEPALKVCALPGCSKEFTHNKCRPKAEFATRKYCSRTCAGKSEKNRGERRKEATHCGSGLHELTPENTYVNPRGHRICRVCKQIRRNVANAEKRAGRPPALRKPAPKPVPIEQLPAPPPPVRILAQLQAVGDTWRYTGFRHYDPTRTRITRPDLHEITCGAWLRAKW